MSNFQSGYHLLAAALQYAWGLIMALGVYVLLPLIAGAIVIGVLDALAVGKGKRNEQL